MQKGDLGNFKVWFHDYVTGFYGSDEKVNIHLELKEKHTMRVCSEMEDLTETLELDESRALIAGAVALFHDVGRFPQFAKYKTYSDQQSVNHGTLGVKVLREKKVLNELTPHERELITAAVGLHGVKKVPDKLADDKKLFVNLIRDADKLDIYQLTINYYRDYLANPEEFKLQLDRPDEPYYTPEVVQGILNGVNIDHKDLQTLNDAKMCRMAWVFDINFPQTLVKIKERRFIEQILGFLPEADDIKEAGKYVLDYIDSRIEQKK